MKTIDYWYIRYADLLLQICKSLEKNDKLYTLIQDYFSLVELPLPDYLIGITKDGYSDLDTFIKENIWKNIENYFMQITEITQEHEKLKELVDRFSLRPHHIKILEFLYLNYRIYSFNNYYDDLSIQNKIKIFSLYVPLNRHKLLEELNDRSYLSKRGLFANNQNFLFQPQNYIITVNINSAIVSYLEDTTGRSLSSYVMQTLESPFYPLETFNLPEETLLSAQSAMKRKGPAFLLFYGEPGTGKSELSKALPLSCGLTPYSLMTDDDDGSRPISSLYLCSKLLDPLREVLIIDEADLLLNSSEPQGPRGGPSSLKAIVNQFLEKVQIKIIFITNQINGIPQSVLRRMHILIGFKTATYQYRKRIWDSMNRSSSLFTPAELQNLAREYRTNPARIRQVYEICSVLKDEGRDPDQIYAVARDMLTRSEELFLPQPVKSLPINDIDMAALHLSLAPQELISRLKKWHLNFPQIKKGVNVLFYGIPGTGKTALAMHIARELNLIPVVTRASDLLSPFVGVTETLIRDVFQEAEGGVLIVDEADSFILNRELNERSWERSQTNEFLTQMESFKGLFIATTNFVKALDGASFRRFSFKVEFLIPTTEQRLALAKRYFSHISWDEELVAGIKNLDGLVPGDFAIVAQRLAFSECIDWAYVLAELQAELKARHHLQRAIGFTSVI